MSVNATLSQEYHNHVTESKWMQGYWEIHVTLIGVVTEVLGIFYLLEESFSLFLNS